MYVCVSLVALSEVQQTTHDGHLSVALHGRAEGGYMLIKICTNVHANKPFDEEQSLISSVIQYSCL